MNLLGSEHCDWFKAFEISYRRSDHESHPDSDSERAKLQCWSPENRIDERKFTISSEFTCI